MEYFPLAWPFLLLLGIFFLIALAMIELEVLTFAYMRMGIHPRYVMTILVLSFFGSYINIPVGRLPPEHIVSNSVVEFFGVQYVVPTVRQWPQTVIAVNVGGAIIPTLLSLYLIVKNQLYIRSVIGVTLLALIVHHLAKPVHGIGISVPIFVPPLCAAGIAMVLAWRCAPPLAYICGCLGTLIGADLMNLDKIQGLGAPVASIGGAGTFDGVFLCGIIAVLLPPFVPRSGRRRYSSP